MIQNTEKYRKFGLKLTPQRLAILRYLDGNKSHPSAEDIYNAVSKEFTTMSFATVYNTLEVLREKGILRELKIEPGKKRYDPDTTPHHHLICIKCKKLIDIYKRFKLTLPEDIAREFEILGNHIEFYGVCPECKQRNSQ
jgi:Fur family peroxide stress response transcriptional regulator